MTPAARLVADARCRGAAMIVTMIVVFALAAMVLAMGRWARVEAIASANALASAQAAAIARGAEQMTLALLTDELQDLPAMSEQEFDAVPLDSGCFWIVRPDYGDNQPRFGLVDESAKLDLNTAAVEALERLPGMTRELAAGIVDWRDGDDNTSDQGAESSAYQSGSEPYRAKNAPFETVEELRLVRGMTHPLLWGEPASASSTLGQERYRLIGLSPYLTVWNSLRNVAIDGSPRLNITPPAQRDAMRRLLRVQLGESRGDEIANRLGPQPLVDLFDLARRGGMSSDELRRIEGLVTSGNSGRRVRGRINVNAAPREVLLGLDRLDESQVDRLLAARGGSQRGQDGSIAWVWDALGDEAVGLGNRLCGRGGQYSADIVAVAASGRAFCRVRVVVDATRTPPRIVYRRDLTDRGWSLSPRVLENLRAGMSLADATKPGAAL